MNSPPVLSWRSRLVAAGAIGLAVWALRVALVGDLGTGIPYADQWDCEGLTLYLPWIEGRLSWRTIFAPYLEHRIAWTHLWNLGLFELCGQWDPMVQMVAQAVIPALTAGFCVWGLVAAQPGWLWRSAVLLGALIGFGAPFSYQNILWGFQSCFGLLVALSLMACGTTALAWSKERYGWLALIAGLAAPLAMGAGILVGPVIGGLTILVMLSERKMTRRSGEMLVAGSICCFWGLWLRSHSTDTVFAYAKSIVQFGHVWLAACAWPNSQMPWLAGLACLPAVILVIQILRRGLLPRPHELFITGVFLWATACAASGAWVRGALGTNPPSRYCDFLTLLCWANLLALVAVLRAWWKQPEARLRVWGVLIAVAWLGSVIYGGTGLLQRFVNTERTALQLSAIRQFDMMNTILDGGVAAAVIVDRRGKELLPHERVMESRVLAPYLPPELQVPCKDVTPEKLLTIGPALGARTWQWQSGPFEAQMSALVVFIDGDSSRVKLNLLNQRDGEKTDFQPSGRHIGTWAEWLVHAPPGRYQMSIEAVTGADGLGLILPRPLSAAGYWVRWISAARTTLLELAGICLAVAWLACRAKADTDQNIVRTD